MVVLARVIAFVAVSALFLLVPPALGQTSDTAFYAIERIAGNLKQPTGIAVSDDGLLYVLERAGRIMILEDGEVLRRPFLDIREKVDAEASFEQGLLGLAFDPAYAENGFFYISYSDSDFSVHLERYQVSPYRYVALPGSGERLLSVPQASSLHKGGHLRFGPDGYLYMSVGDGGLSEELDSTGQNIDDLRGKILRLDVSGAPPYAIPEDNPLSASRVIARKSGCWACAIPGNSASRRARGRYSSPMSAGRVSKKSITCRPMMRGRQFRLADI